MGALAIAVFCTSSLKVALLAESQRMRGKGDTGRKMLASPEKCTLTFEGTSANNLENASLACESLTNSLSRSNNFILSQLSSDVLISKDSIKRPSSTAFNNNGSIVSSPGKPGGGFPAFFSSYPSPIVFPPYVPDDIYAEGDPLIVQQVLQQP
uniref:Uncharacterized protein n=1 Tax=Glossina austeni TaxID=7395 RepID=A0A1A9VBW7_GLOAU